MATFRADRSRSWPIKAGLEKITFPFCFILIIISLILAHQRFFRVASVSCRSGEQACPEAVESLISTNLSRSLLTLNLARIKKEVLATGLVETAEIKVKFPGRLTLIVTPPASSYFLNCLFTLTPPGFSYDQATSAAEIVPPSTDLAAFLATNSGKTFQLLSTGVLTQADSDTDYNLILNSIPGKQYLSAVFSWLKALGDAGLKPSALYFLSDQLVIRQADQPDLLMRLSDDPREKLIALQRLNQAATINKPKVIDFRYTHPILK